MPDLLIELFSEEIPARMQARAAADLKRLVTDGLVEAGLTYASAGAFATPRRLTLSVDGVLAASPSVVEERKGPRVGAPDKAIEGFLRGAGVSRDDLVIRDEKRGEMYFALINKPGRRRRKSSLKFWKKPSVISHGRNPCAGVLALCAGCGHCTRSYAF